MLYKQSGLKLVLVLITASLLSACGNGKKELSEFTPIGATVSSSVAVDESSSTAIVVSSSSTTPISSSLDASSSSEASIASVSSTATSQSSTSAPTAVSCASDTVEKGQKAYQEKCTVCHGDVATDPNTVWTGSISRQGIDLFDMGRDGYNKFNGEDKVPSDSMVEYLAAYMPSESNPVSTEVAGQIAAYMTSTVGRPWCPGNEWPSAGKVSTSTPASPSSAAESSSSIAPGSLPANSSVPSSVVATPSSIATSSIASSSTPIAPSSVAQSSSSAPVPSSSSPVTPSSSSVESSSTSSTLASSSSSSISQASSSSAPQGCMDIVSAGEELYFRGGFGCEGCHGNLENIVGDFADGLVGDMYIFDSNAATGAAGYDTNNPKGTFVTMSLPEYLAIYMPFSTSPVSAEQGEKIAAFLADKAGGSWCPGDDWPVQSDSSSSTESSVASSSSAPSVSCDADVQAGMGLYASKICVACHGPVPTDTTIWTGPASPNGIDLFDDANDGYDPNTGEDLKLLGLPEYLAMYMPNAGAPVTLEEAGQITAYMTSVAGQPWCPGTPWP